MVLAVGGTLRRGCSDQRKSPRGVMRALLSDAGDASAAYPLLGVNSLGSVLRHATQQVISVADPLSVTILPSIRCPPIVEPRSARIQRI